MLTEKPGRRPSIASVLKQAIEDHYLGVDVVARIVAEVGNLPGAAARVREQLPTKVRVRSGDLGELFAAEYVAEKTTFELPVKRLRYKEDRDLPMRGDDILAIDRNAGSPRALKVEAKSASTMREATVKSAASALARHGGRPSPGSLAFTSSKLRRENRDDLANLIEEVQTGKRQWGEVQHLVFTLSGNDPRDTYTPHVTPPANAPRRCFVGVVVDDHQTFIRTAYELV